MSWAEIGTNKTHKQLHQETLKGINSNPQEPLDKKINMIYQQLFPPYDKEVKGFGTGAHGEVIYDASTFELIQDNMKRYVINATNFIIPKGVTLTPPLECSGLYIFSHGDIIINGTIDMSKKGTQAYVGNFPKTITVFDTMYNLAIGGRTVNGSTGGNSGTCYNYYCCKLTAAAGLASRIVTTSSPSVNGGQWSYSSGGGNGGADYTVYNPTTHVQRDGSVGKEFCNTYTTGAIVLVAHGKIEINGAIISTGVGSGRAPTNGGNGSATYSNGNLSLMQTIGGKGGNGAVAPSGGGPITMIGKEIICNGLIDNKGESITYANAEAGNQVSKERAWANGGYGGTGGSFTSQAGEIKSYIGVWY